MEDFPNFDQDNDVFDFFDSPVVNGVSDGDLNGPDGPEKTPTSRQLELQPSGKESDKGSVADSEATDDDSKDPTVDLTNVAVNTDLSTRVWTARGTSERVNAYDLQDAAACDEIANKAWNFVSRVNFEIAYQRTTTKGKASPIVSGICMKHIRYNMRTTKPLWLTIVYVPLQGVKQINSCWVVSAGQLASRKLLDEAKHAFSTFVVHLTLATPKEANKLPTSAVPGTLATSGRPVRSRAKEAKKSAKVRDCLS